MKRVLVLLGVVALSTALAGPAWSDPVQRLRTFGTGDVTVTDGVVTIVNDVDEYGGVYVSSKSQSGKPLADASFSFRNAGGDIAGGAPRLSIPIDDPATEETLDGYAFLDVYWCGGMAGDTTLVSTESESCVVWYGSTSYANWDAFAEANPTYRIAPGHIPFVIADWPGSYAVTDVTLR
jgi:hypothetical protein